MSELPRSIAVPNRRGANSGLSETESFERLATCETARRISRTPALRPPKASEVGRFRGVGAEPDDGWRPRVSSLN